MCSVSTPGESPFHFRSTNPVMNFYSKQSPQLGVLVISWQRQTFRPVCLVLCQSHGAWGEKDTTVTCMWLACDTWPACDSCDWHVTRDLHVTHMTGMWHVTCMWLTWLTCDTWPTCDSHDWHVTRDLHVTDMWPACDWHVMHSCVHVRRCALQNTKSKTSFQRCRRCQVNDLVWWLVPWTLDGRMGLHLLSVTLYMYTLACFYILSHTIVIICSQYCGV